MPTPIIDTRLHLICRDRLLYPWLAAIHVITLGCARHERARLFSLNARRIWRLPG